MVVDNGRLIDALRIDLGQRFVSFITYHDEDPLEKILLVTSDTSISTLSLCKHVFDNTGLSKKDVPLIFSSSDIFSAAAVSPLEILMIKDHYSVQYGKDILHDFLYNKSVLSVQCESTLRGRIFILQQAFLQGVALDQLLLDAYPFFVACLRNIVRLFADQPPKASTDIFSAIQANLKVDCNFLVQMNDHIQHDRLGKRLAGELFPGFIEFFHAIADNLRTLDV